MKTSSMRDTKYAKELSRAHLVLDGGDEARIECIYVKGEEQEEIRFSWWKDGKMMMRPLDLSEKDLLSLLHNAIAEDVFTPEFRAKLRDVL